jgi:signal transduction histidine kinase
MVGKAIKELRNTVWAMQHAEVSTEELEDKLYNLVAQAVTEAEIEVSFDLPAPMMLSSQEGLNLFRIIQEALQNAVKYSHATRIKISVMMTKNNEIVVSISDNGIGFELEKAQLQKGHYGLLNMQARAELMNASFHIQTMPQQGTLVEIILALKS